MHLLRLRVLPYPTLAPTSTVSVLAGVQVPTRRVRFGPLPKLSGMAVGDTLSTPRSETAPKQPDDRGGRRPRTRTGCASGKTRHQMRRRQAAMCAMRSRSVKCLHVHLSPSEPDYAPSGSAVGPRADRSHVAPARVLLRESRGAGRWRGEVAIG